MKIRIIKESRLDEASLEPWHASDNPEVGPARRTGREGGGVVDFIESLELPRDEKNTLKMLKSKYASGAGINTEKLLSLTNRRPDPNLIQRISLLVDELQKKGHLRDEASLKTIATLSSDSEVEHSNEWLHDVIDMILRIDGILRGPEPGTTRRGEALEESTMKIRIIKESRASDLTHRVTDTDPSSEAETGILPKAPQDMKIFLNKIAEEIEEMSVEELAAANEERAFFSIGTAIMNAEGEGMDRPREGGQL